MNATTIKNRDRILEAIDQLRRRKARPDIQRICNYLFRRFSINFSEAKSDLQWCVENDIVLKVEYKGSISYRNAAKKYSHVKRDNQSDNSADNKANRKFAQLLTNAFGELVVQEPDYLEYGVPAEEIINNILSKDSVRYTKKYISILIEKEVENGGLIKMENDNYLMGPTKEEGRRTDDGDVNNKGASGDVKDGDDQSQDLLINVKPRKKPGPKPGIKKEKSSENMDSDEKKSENGSLRVGGRRKVLFCLNGEDMMLRMHPDSTWQCPHCKSCVVCYETSDAGFLAVCAVCADAYHAGCHQPRIPDKIKSNMRWLCINCEMPEELKINEIQSNMSNSFSQKINQCNDTNDNNSSSPSMSGNTTPNYQSPPLSPTPPQLSPQNEIQQNGDGGVSDSQSNKDSDDDNIDPSIPDASNWTSEEVYQYFAQYFPEEANIFREQEIDGRSLLLMKRIDVLTNLKLKLGPALKIYKHVVKLQVRRDDPKLYWL
ncbi:histone acetyltransferase KAT6A [Asbolus verrucosus]|uniref:Histone acetyltransferase KAT6A n=1 Tax=Asbolus verrucosus TaxID=1661398 RepID=A0A482VQ71_ASBVE|nr:histone acetyltransferase KAT6A [Asbolus verrucosus]